MKCPLCDKEMMLEEYEGVEITVCSNCGGVWLDKGEIAKIVDAEEVEFTPSEIRDTLEEMAGQKKIREELTQGIRFFKKDVSLEEFDRDEILKAFRQKWGEPRDIRCPKCQEVMKTFEYAGTGVMIDRCTQGHGFMLDGGELEKVQIMMEYHKRKFAAVVPPQGMLTTDKKCPVCKEKLLEKEYEAVPIDLCFKCGGVWLDDDELYQIAERREAAFSEEEKVEALQEQMQSPQATDLIEEIKCAICGALMKRSAYACTSGVIIDRCPHGHGTWLDKGEVDKVQIYAEQSEELGDEELAEYTRLLNQVRLDYEKRREEVVQSMKVSRFEAARGLMRWLARE